MSDSIDEAPHATTRATTREWLGLAVLMFPVLLIAMDVTVLHFALPWLSAELHPSGTQLLWIVDIYTFCLAGFLLVMGTLGDRIGRRRLLLIGAVAFGGASVLAAYSTSAEMLIAARALLGVAGATLMPSTLALIRTMFGDPAQRRMAIALWTGGFVVGSAIGPLVGGGLLEYFWWGSVFLINVPVMVLLLLTAPVLLPEYRDPAQGRLDLPSALLALATILLIIYGIKELARDGLVLGPGLAVLLGALIGIRFVLRQLRLADPLVEVRLFRSPAVSVSLFALLLGMFALPGIMLFASQYLQLVREMSPFVAGLWTLPMVGLSAVGAITGAILSQRIRPGFVVASFLIVAAVGLGVIMWITPDMHLGLVVLGLGLVGAGMGGIAALATDLVVTSAPPQRAGAASSMSESASELGGALGVAILGAVGMAVYQRDLTETAPTELPAAALDAARETLPGAVSVATEVPGELAVPLLDAAFSAFTDGIQLAAAIACALLVVGAGLTARLLRHIPAGTSPPTTD